MDIAEQIKKGMALAFFACAYADQWEESETTDLNPSGCDWIDLIPDDIDPAALHAADTLLFGMCEKTQYAGAAAPVLAARVDLIYQMAVRINATDSGDRVLTPELFGHYCAMQAMGSGVGLESFGNAVHDAIKVPYVEFGGYSLSKDYF